MNGSYDVAIIGAGVSGTAIARELSRYRLSIALLEKEAEPAFGVSKSNSGIVHPGTQMAPGLLKARLCVQGNRMMRPLARELGVDFKQVGELIVAFDDDEIRRLAQIKRDGERLGVPGLRMVDRRWLTRREPTLNPAVAAALYAPTAGIISPYRLAYDLSENAVRNGVTMLTNARVSAIIREGAAFLLVTPGGEIRCRYVINAAGLWADEVARMAGVSDFSIRPRKGQEYLLDKKRRNMTRHLIFPLPTPTSKGVLIIKTSDGNPMVGPTAEEVEDKNDLSTSDAGFAGVFAQAKRLVPSVSEKDVIAYFAGLRPVSGEDFIIRAETSVPGMVTVAGIQSPGLTAAPAIAAMAVDLVRASGLALRRKRHFAAHRRASVHLFAIPWARTRALIRKNPAYGDIVCRCEMVSAQEVREAIARGARTMDGIKFRTRAQAGRCHGSFCTGRLMRIIAEETKQPLIAVSKRGPGSELIVKDRAHETA